MNYRTALIDRFWDFAESADLVGLLDGERSASRPPVFKSEYTNHNLLFPNTGDSNYKAQLTNVIPQSRRHRWFRSMTSSQALAQSVFGNLHLLGCVHVLEGLQTEDGSPFLDYLPLRVELEYEVNCLGEPRPTSVDVLFEGPHRYRIAVECKLSEPDVGSCSRPRLTPDDANYCRDYCDGSYAPQRGRIERCSLTAIGVRYWDHVPALFDWSSEDDQPECPLRLTYQLVRNVLAACVRQGDLGGATTASPVHGHAVLLYDERNPAFLDGGAGDREFRNVSKALKVGSLLRRCSWQALAGTLGQVPQLGWLVDGMARKYGIEGHAAPYNEAGLRVLKPPVIGRTGAGDLLGLRRLQGSAPFWLG